MIGTHIGVTVSSKMSIYQNMMGQTWPSGQHVPTPGLDHSTCVAYRIRLHEYCYGSWDIGDDKFACV